MYMCIRVHMYIYTNNTCIKQVYIPFFVSPKYKKKFFYMLDTHSGSRTDWRLFIVIVYPIAVTVHIFPSRNVTVFDYRVLPQTLLKVLFTIQFIYLNTFLNVKTSQFQNI